MLTPVQSTQFKKDVKKARKREFSARDFEVVIPALTRPVVRRTGTKVQK